MERERVSLHNSSFLGASLFQRPGGHQRAPVYREHRADEYVEKENFNRRDCGRRGATDFSSSLQVRISGRFEGGGETGKRERERERLS